MRKLVPAALLLAAAAYLTPFNVYGLESNDFRWHGRIKPGNTVELKGINGAIIAQGASASGEVEVTARKTARRSDPNSVRIDVIEHDGAGSR